MEAKTGVYTAAEINLPSSGNVNKYLDLKAPSTWSAIWVVVAFVYLACVLKGGK